jgi:vacuolar-type H+-ATPase subunit I/STV1
MRTISTISAGILLFISFLNCSVSGAPAEADANSSPTEAKDKTRQTSQQAERPVKKMDFVKLVDFQLNNGTFVSGQLISEDKNKIVVKEVQDAAMVVSTYSKKEIAPRTLGTKNMLEYKYYLSLAEHFSAKTWDFQNDPDKFIQAIRCYEKAKQLLVDAGRQDNEPNQINEKIKQLQADREVWTREVESRAKLKKLEFESTIEQKLKDIENKLNATSQQLDKNMQQIDKTVATVQDNYQKLEANVSKTNEDITQQLKSLENRIKEDERIIGRGIWYP